MAWLDIKSAIVDMLTLDGFVVANNTKLSRDIDSYLVVASSDEKNTDFSSNYVGVTKYRNERAFQIIVYHKKTTSNVNLDVVIESVKDEMELSLEKIKLLFSTVYNFVGDAGARSLRYIGMVFESVATEGIYAPVRMVITFKVEFLQNRS